MNIHRFQQAFTLVELLITMAIVSIVSAIAYSSYNGYIEATKVAAARSQIQTLSLLIDDYYLENGYYPSNLEQIGNENLVDPWGNKYNFLNFREAASAITGLQYKHQKPDPGIIGSARKDKNLVPINTNYDLFSSGKDGKTKPPLVAKDSQDDIIYANDGDYIGLAREF